MLDLHPHVDEIELSMFDSGVLAGSVNKSTHIVNKSSDSNDIV